MTSETKNDVKKELVSPTFILALLSFLGTVGVGFYTLGMMRQEVTAASIKNTEQDIRAERLAEKMDAGFNRVADKIDDLRKELRPSNK